MGTTRASSTDDVQVALHDLGGDGVELLMSHATGFHGRCWQPVADHLNDRFHCTAFDFRGHGDTAAPHDWVVDWERYGDDAVAVAHHLVARSQRPLLAIGHSMGGACLLMAAHRAPGLFAGLVLFEPIVFPPGRVDPTDDGPSLAVGARRRRASFASFDDAIANYASKPPLQHFTPEALRLYVEHGFRRGDDGEVHLKCTPEHEARTFESGARHGTWEVLGEIDTPCWVIAGRIDGPGPAMLASRIADRLPNSHYVELTHLDHFGPMTHPDQVADLVRQLADELDT